MTSPNDESPTTRRQVALAVVGFMATLVLLFGLSQVVDRMSGAASASPTPSPTRPSPVPSRATAAPSPAATPSASASTSPAASASGQAPSPTPSPTTVPADAVIVGAGDIGHCDTTDDDATAGLIEDIEGTVFTAGDNAYPDGDAQDFRDCYDPNWGRFKDRTRPAPGNHDWATKDLKGYLDYFGTAAAPDGVPWYSYDLAAWHVIVLDSMCDETGGCGTGSDQGRWLAADLAASTTKCTLAIWHQPRFSSGVHGNDRGVAPFWEALYAAGADVVVNGHDHDYERFAPQDPGGREDRERGIRQFVVGTGGAELRDFDNVRRNSELRAAVTAGVLKLVLRADSYEWTFIPTQPSFSDSGSGPCH